MPARLGPCSQTVILVVTRQAFDGKILIGISPWQAAFLLNFLSCHFVYYSGSGIAHLTKRIFGGKMKFIMTMVLACVPFFLGAQEKGPRVGDPAPDFSLPFATKDSVAEGKLTLSTLFGKCNIVLAFYPADWSGGCTKEMCTMRDNFSELSKLNAEILPISGDYEYSHHEWAKALNLPFKLLADHDHAVARTFSSYNSDHGMNKRTVYLINKSGKIAYIDLDYKARENASFEKLQEAIRKLSE